MAENFWLGVVIPTVLGIMAWAFRQIYVTIKRQKDEIEQLKDERANDSQVHFEHTSKQIIERLNSLEKTMQASNRELEKDLRQNILSVTEVKVEIRNFSDALILIRELSRDVSRIKGYIKVSQKEDLDDDDGGADH